MRRRIGGQAYGHRAILHFAGRAIPQPENGPDLLAHRSGREKIWPAITLGIVALMLLTLVMQLAFYADVSAYESCLESAQTQQARGACEQLREQSPSGSRLLFE